MSTTIATLNGKARHFDQPRIPTIRVEKLTKDYVMGDNVVHALRGVSLEVSAGEFGFGLLDARQLAEWILADRLPVRFQLQMHKYIWAPDMRGV